MSNVKIIKPIAKYANENGNFPSTNITTIATTTTTTAAATTTTATTATATTATATTAKPLAVAATTLKEGSVVYLLHQLPYNFLLTNFYNHNQHYNKIPVCAIWKKKQALSSRQKNVSLYR